MPDFLYYDGLHFCQAIICGVILSLLYDCIRVWRRLVPHKRVFWMGVEDILFWIVAGIELFLLSFETRSGIVRGFLVAGAILGALAYQVILGRFLVNIVSKILKFPLKKLKAWGTIISDKMRRVRMAGKEEKRGNRQKTAEK
ncbi:MAG: spore cortex biosynthesis protein YabQ [Lachnospiraceae bacterium]